MVTLFRSDTMVLPGRNTAVIIGLRETKCVNDQPLLSSIRPQADLVQQWLAADAARARS